MISCHLRSILFPYTTLFRSKLTYNQNFLDSAREVQLTGEAYFDVVPAVSQTTGQRIPFIIHTSRSEEHTSELQSPCNLVCRLLLEKKKFIKLIHIIINIHYI